MREVLGLGGGGGEGGGLVITPNRNSCPHTNVCVFVLPYHL